MTEQVSEEKSDDGQFQRYLYLGAFGAGAVILLPLIVGLGVAILAEPEPTAIRFGMIRDIMLVILAMQGILVIVALVVLILQIARLIALFESEIKPMVDDTKETLETAKGTAQFVGKNVSEPFISVSAFLVGFRVFVVELLGIRRAVRRDRKK